jgi:hypothetical protein
VLDGEPDLGVSGIDAQVPGRTTTGLAKALRESPCVAVACSGGVQLVVIASIA